MDTCLSLDPTQECQDSISTQLAGHLSVEKIRLHGVCDPFRRFPPKSVGRTGGFLTKIRVFLAGYYKAFCLGNGSCRLCAKCNTRGWIHTEQARPSMEACGIDVHITLHQTLV